MALWMIKVDPGRLLMDSKSWPKATEVHNVSTYCSET